LEVQQPARDRTAEAPALADHCRGTGPDLLTSGFGAEREHHPVPDVPQSLGVRARHIQSAAIGQCPEPLATAFAVRARLEPAGQQHRIPPAQLRVLGEQVERGIRADREQRHVGNLADAGQ
jgi:hypothetical protein